MSVPLVEEERYTGLLVVVPGGFPGEPRPSGVVGGLLVL